MNSGKPDSTAELAERGGAVGETIIANQETKTPRVMGVGHVALSEFYREVLGFQVVPTETSDLGENVFLSSHPAEVSVDLALFRNPAFEVRSLSDLRTFYQRVLDRSVPVKMALNHGVSLSFYFDDPEGHLIEVYWPTGVACLARHGDPIDLTLPEEALRRDVMELKPRERSK
jgi:catechol-2,3-dioxygenase